MSEIVVAREPNEKAAMHAFLHAHNVRVPASDDFQAFGVVRDNALVAVVAYNGFYGRVCSMHVAGDGGHWATRELLEAVFDYPFRQCDCVAVFAAVASTNARALKLDRHLGFEEVHRVPGGRAPGVDLVVLELQRDRCRYFPQLREREPQLREQVAA